MRQFDKDKILGNVVECSNEEQCKELIDWYIKDVNRMSVDWDLIPRGTWETYGILIKKDKWNYTDISWYKLNGYKIIPFKEALLSNSKQEIQTIRYYYVSYLYTNKDGFGSGSCYSQSDSVGINIPLVEEKLSENIKGTYTILSFTELTKEHYELCCGGVE